MKSSKVQKKFKIFLLYYQQNIESSVNPDFVVLQINHIKYIYIYIYAKYENISVIATYQPTMQVLNAI